MNLTENESPVLGTGAIAHFGRFGWSRASTLTWASVMSWIVTGTSLILGAA